MIDTATGRVRKRLIVSRVKFARLSQEQIEWYISTGEPFHAAGAYSIQGKGRAFIERVDGCLTNIIGVSIPVVFGMLEKMDCRL
jgi:septum formation protein